MWFQYSVQAFIERPWGEVSAPVVVVSIRIREKVSAYHRQRQLANVHAIRIHASAFTQGLEIIWNGSKLGLQRETKEVYS